MCCAHEMKTWLSYPNMICLPTENEAPECFLPQEPPVCEQIILISPEQSRTSHLLMFAVCLSLSFLVAV